MCFIMHNCIFFFFFLSVLGKPGGRGGGGGGGGGPAKMRKSCKMGLPEKEH